MSLPVRPEPVEGLVYEELPHFACLGPRFDFATCSPCSSSGNSVSPSGTTSPREDAPTSPVSWYERRYSSLTKNIQMQNPSRAMSSWCRSHGQIFLRSSSGSSDNVIQGQYSRP